MVKGKICLKLNISEEPQILVLILGLKHDVVELCALYLFLEKPLLTHQHYTQ